MKLSSAGWDHSAAASTGSTAAGSGSTAAGTGSTAASSVGRGSCRCFTVMPIEGYPRGSEFVGRVSLRSGTRRCKEK
jgi:hypothetical protein